VIRVFPLLVLLLLSAPTTLRGADDAELLFWGATKPGGGRIYLLGSLGARREPPGPVDPTVERAFAAADGLAVETHFDAAEQKALQDQLVALAFLAEGQRLQDKVSSQTYARVQIALDGLGRPAGALDYFEPWFVGLYLSSSTRGLLGYRGEYGLPSRLVARARDQKPIESLETEQEFLSLRSELPDELQSLMLEKTLDHLGPRRLQRIDDAFAANDAAGLDALFFQDLRADPATAPYYERAVFARSRRIAERLDALAASGETWLAVLPVGNLLGERSVGAVLAERGYTVERLAPGEPEAAEPNGPASDPEADVEP
jgi:uncharacterized protein YbaP (TraB family)